MDISAYVLTTDDGREHRQLTNQPGTLGWSSVIQQGMTIIMSVVIRQPDFLNTYICPFCNCWNRLKENNGQSSTDWWALSPVFSKLWWVCSYTFSRSCKRHFQIQPANELDFYQRLRPNVVTATVTKHERDLIRNIYLKKSVSSTYYVPSNSVLTWPWSPLNFQPVRNAIRWTAQAMLTVFNPLWTLSSCVQPFPLPVQSMLTSFRPFFTVSLGLCVTPFNYMSYSFRTDFTTALDPQRIDTHPSIYLDHPSPPDSPPLLAQAKLPDVAILPLHNSLLD